MKKKILALALFSFLATSCGPSSPPKYKYDFTFDATKGNVTSSLAKGEYEAGTSITLTSTALSGFEFVGYFDSTNDSLISEEKTYTFTLEKDTSFEIKFAKADVTYNFDYSFDETKGNVTSTSPKGKVKENTEITLTASLKNSNCFFDGYFDKAGTLLGKDLTYTFKITSDTTIEARFGEHVKPSDEDLSVLKGTFNSSIGTLVITNEKVSLKGKELEFDYKFNEVKTEDLSVNRDKVIYFGKNNLYRLYLSDTEFKNPVIEKKVDGSYQELATFMPTINEFSGAYFTSYTPGDPFDPSFTSLFISNDFDSDRDIYFVNYSFLNNAFNNINTYFLTSGFQEIEGKLTKVVRQYDFADETLIGSYYLSKNGEKTILKGTNDSSNDYYSCEAPFNASYWNEKETLSFKYDATKKVTTLGDKEYKIAISYDENGALYTLTSGEITRKFRVSAFGLEEITSSGNVSYAFDGNEKYINGEFTSGAYKAKVDIKGKKVVINEKEATFEYVLREKRKAIEAKIEGKTYTIFGFKDDTQDNYVIRLSVDGANSYLVNKELYKNHFVGTHVYKSFQGKEKIVIDNQLNFTFNETTKKVDLEYDVKSDSVYIEYLENEKPYKFYLEDESLKAFILSSESEEKIFLPEAQFERFKGAYTTKINPTLVFENDKLKFNGKEYDYRVDLIFEEKTFANYVNITITEGAINTTFIIDALGTIAEYKGTKTDGSLNFGDTYIKEADAIALVGRYSLETKFGEENFEFKSDGTFYADQLRGDGEALQENVKKEFTLSYSTFEGKVVPTINFVHGSTTIFVKKVGESLVTFDNYYSKDYIFKFNGYYSNAEHALKLYQNKLTLDGTDYNIDSSKKEGTKTTLVSGTTTFTFDEVEQKKAVEVKTSDATFRLNLSSFDSLKLNGATLKDEATSPFVVTLKEDKVTGIKKVVLSDGMMEYEGKYVIHEGKEALKFSVMFDTYYAYLEGGVPTLSKAGGLLPPPPPPPPLPPLPF